MAQLLSGKYLERELTPEKVIIILGYVADFIEQFELCKRLVSYDKVWPQIFTGYRYDRIVEVYPSAKTLCLNCREDSSPRKILDA